MEKLTFLFSWVLFIFLSPVFISLFILFFTYRSIVIALSWLFRKDLTKVVSGLDVSFCVDQFWTRPKGGTSFIWMVAGELDPTLIKDRFDKAIRGYQNDKDNLEGKVVPVVEYDYEKLTSVYPEFWLGYPFWRKVSQEFRMENHFKLLQVPSGGQFQSIEHLNGFISSWMRQGFTQGLPLWELMFLSPFTVHQSTQKMSIVALKIHHVIGDGYSKLRLLEKIVDHPVTTIGTLEGKGQKSKTLIKENLLDLAYLPPALLKFTKDFLLHKDYFTEKKSNSEVMMGRTKVSLDKLKIIRQKFKTHFKTADNVPLIAVVASVFAGALRRFLKAKGKRRVCSKGTNFLMALPLQDEHPGDFRFCNHWTYGIFNIEIEEGNPVTRLLKLNKNYKRCLDQRFPRVYHSLLLPFQSVIPKVFWQRLTEFNMGSPVGSTNMVGPSTKVFLGGKQVLHKYAYVGLLWKHSSMTAAFFSYGGTMSGTLVANKDVIPDLTLAQTVMHTFFHQELELLLHILG